MSFWDIVWFIIITFAFVAYLMILFNILGDLFRDKDTGGFAKAIWVIALIFAPFLTALIYLIAEHDGMAERSAKDAQGQREQMDAYVRSVAGSGGAAAEIEKANNLLASGAISQSEFDAIKAKALAA